MYMTRLYTINELLHNSTIANTPEDFIKDENIRDFAKETFCRLAQGKQIHDLSLLSEEDLAEYQKDVSRVIYNPEILRCIWNYRLELMNNSNLDFRQIQEFITEVYQYIEEYSIQIPINESYEKGESIVKPEYILDNERRIKVQNVISGIKKELNELYIANRLPQTLLLSKKNIGDDFLRAGFNDVNVEEVDVEEALSVIEIRYNIEDLTSNKSR